MSNSEQDVSRQLVRQWSRVLPFTMRILVWGAIFGILYLLRSFFLLIFLTFVFAYIQANGVNRLQNRIKNRTVRTVLVASMLLAVFLVIGAYIIPRVKDQAEVFVKRAPTYFQTLDKSVIDLSVRYPVLKEFLMLPLEREHHDNTYTEGEPFDFRKSPSANLIQQSIGMGDSGDSQAGFKHTLDAVRNISAYLLALGSAFLLSLLFSFLIVLDLPGLTKGVKSLKDTRLRFIYLEVENSIRTFAIVLGRAFEAQLFIAILNTILTAIGVIAMGIGEKVAFISVIVFLCSFIPVAGVFISSMPICLVALQESGVSLMLIAILLITVIHMVEAYILNPKIYGHHLRMNPVIVLIILTIGGKMFGVWGLVLGVPVCTYIFGHAIQYKKTPPES